MAGGRRKKLHFSKFFSFSCGRGSALRDDGDPSRIGGPGFSRVAFANDPDCFEARNLG
ncbi:putative phospholipid-transporting ATPase 9 [Iris pallida]|uniref:Phospholipid-transporting ATPase 9 n=1 Tax=Iris pallida TaxID=29817 RepID=A0AAX6HCF5_IRIPA|nr:putative phospholipid-transporting ATPase 9 [Iris pallida]